MTSTAGAAGPAGSAGTLPALLSGALAADPARPLLTFHDGATGERTELSVTTFANWVAKTANLLVDDVGVLPGDVVEVRLPGHWQAAVWLQAAWTVGLVVRLPGAEEEGPGPDLAVVEHGTTAPDAREVVSLGLGPMGLARPGLGPADPGALDYDRTVHGHGDRFAAATPPTPEAPALAVAGRRVDQATLAAAARAAQAPGSILVVGPLTTVRAVLAGVLVPLASGVTAVLARHLDPSGLARVVTQEQVVAGVRTDPGQVTGELPEWNRTVAGYGLG